MLINGETRLQMARRHVTGQEALIARQKVLIQRLEAASMPTDAAKRTLQTMKRILVMYRNELAHLASRSPRALSHPESPP
jgi:hypothetical protein